MAKFLPYMAVCLVCWSEICAATIVFEGRPPVNRRAVERVSRNSAVSADSLQALLRNEGYLDAVVRDERDIVRIKAGERFVIDSITWMPDSVTQVIFSVPFTQVNTELLIEQKLRQYRELGHFYASASVMNVRAISSGISLIIGLNPGPLLTLGRNVFTGLKRTRPQLIEEYIGVSEGQPLTEKNLAYIEKRAAAIPFVNFRPPLKIRPQPGYTGANLEFVFEEKKQVLFSGGGGLVPGTSSSLVWNLDLKFQNIFGGGRMFSLRSEKREAGRQTLEVGYRQPALLLGLGEVGVQVATRDYRDQFYEFAAAADYRTRFGPAFAVGWKLGWRSVEPSNSTPSSSTLLSAFTIERTVLDNVMNPSSGLKLGWAISFAYRRYSDDSLMTGSVQNSYNDTRSVVSTQWYQRVKGIFVGHVALNYQGLETGETLPPVSELFFVGGPGSLRGYRNEQFAAVRTAFGTVEPRLRFDSGYLFLFFDAAYVNNRVADADGRNVTDEFFRYSYGLGTTIIDRTRSVKISVGWNPDAAFDQPRLSVEFSADI